MSTFDLIWARFTRVLSFFVGLSMMVYETIGDHSDRPWLYAAAVGMMGLPIARAAEEIIGRIGASGPYLTPKPPPPPTPEVETPREGKIP